jgi:hypothetical protein
LVVLGIRVQHLRERRVEEEQEERRDTRERRTVAAERMVRKEDTVRLISAEGYEFVIEREAALVSNTLKNMLTSTGA